MKAVKIIEKNLATLCELESPTLKSNHAIVKVHYSGVCGSDLHVFLGIHQRVNPPASCIQGHEAVGEILSIDISSKTQLKVGDKVAINPCVGCGSCIYCNHGSFNMCLERKVIGFQLDGTMANKILVPVDNLVKLKDDTNMRTAALIEPIAVAIHAINKVPKDILKSAPIVITGGGTIGSLVGLMLRKIMGIESIFIEIDHLKSAQLKQIGFTVEESLEKYSLNQNMRTIVFECTGYKPMLDIILSADPAPSYLIIVGQYSSTETLSTFLLSKRETIIVASQMHIPEDWIIAAQQMDSELELVLSDMIYPNDFKLESCNEAFLTALNATKGKIKVLIDCKD